jgi:hypothetical protein
MAKYRKLPEKVLAGSKNIVFNSEKILKGIYSGGRSGKLYAV